MVQALERRGLPFQEDLADRVVALLEQFDGHVVAAFAGDIHGLADLGQPARAATAHRYQSAWLDAPFADETEAAVLAHTLPPHWWTQRNLLPVTGPDRPVAHQAFVLAAAQLHSGGLGIRVRVPGEWHDPTAAAVRDLLDRTDPTVPVDLLLDLGAVLAPRSGAAKEALRALDALVPLASWRTVVVASGGFPEPPDDFWEGACYEAPRPDWDTWNEIHHSGRSYLPSLCYGDYGILPATRGRLTPLCRQPTRSLHTHLQRRSTGSEMHSPRSPIPPASRPS